MSDVRIQDGKGTGNMTFVDSNNRVHTQSISLPVQEALGSTADTYNVNSSQTDGTTITLTNATETPILYFQNGEDKDAVIDLIVFMAGPSTGGTTNPKWRVYKKSSAMSGDIVTEAKACVFENKNFGSTKTMGSSVAYRGAVGDANLDSAATLAVASIVSDDARAGLNLGGLILPKSSSVLITCEAGTSNTSMEVMAALSVSHLKDLVI